jgi:hypothetical protein
MSTTIRHSNGTRRAYDTREAAEAALRAQYPDLYVHDDGARVLAWESEEASVDDPGARAIAELVSA